MSERQFNTARIGAEEEELIHASKLLSLQAEGLAKGYVRFHTLANQLVSVAAILNGLSQKARARGEQI